MVRRHPVDAVVEEDEAGGASGRLTCVRRRLELAAERRERANLDEAGEEHALREDAEEPLAVAFAALYEVCCAEK